MKKAQEKNLSARHVFSPGESGQGTIEYILVLVIVIIIALSLLYRFNDSFRGYAESFFDGYIACLLETGELPGTGSKCNSEFVAFDGKSGKELLKDKLPQAGKGGTAPKATTSSKSNGGGARETTGGGRDNSVGFLRNRGGEAATPVGKVASSDSGGGGNDLLLGSMGGHPVGNMRDSYRPRSISMSFSNEGGFEDSDDGTKSKKKSTGKSIDNSDDRRPTKAIENLEARRKTASEEENKGFSISALIRFIIILLIIVAMVIFFGGQLLAVARGRDKGGGGD
jgi:hypothetical protein